MLATFFTIVYNTINASKKPESGGMMPLLIFSNISFLFCLVFFVFKHKNLSLSDLTPACFEALICFVLLVALKSVLWHISVKRFFDAGLASAELKGSNIHKYKLVLRNSSLVFKAIYKKETSHQTCFQHLAFMSS